MQCHQHRALRLGRLRGGFSRVQHGLEDLHEAGDPCRHLGHVAQDERGKRRHHLRPLGQRRAAQHIGEVVEHVGGQAGTTGALQLRDQLRHREEGGLMLGRHLGALHEGLVPHRAVQIRGAAPHIHTRLFKGGSHVGV